MKTETMEKVHNVLTVPGKFLPLMNNIFSAGDYILDYILPPPEGVKSIPAPGNHPIAYPDADTPADYSVLLRALIARMKLFTERVHERLVIYSREKWFPGLLNSVGSFKGGVENSVSGAKKFLNGHANSESSTPKANGQASAAKPEPEKTSSKPKKNKKKAAENEKEPERPLVNGDAQHDQEQSSQQQL